MIPLIKKLDIDEINTALIAIRKLLNNVGITETNITNVIGKDYDAKIQELEEKVEADDTYSTTEVKTNKKWIDGKPIYRKFYNLNLTVRSTGWINIGITDTVIDKIISADCFGNDTSYPILYMKFGFVMVSKNNNNELMLYAYNWCDYKGIVLEYTKTTD